LLESWNELVAELWVFSVQWRELGIYSLLAEHLNRRRQVSHKILDNIS